MKLLYTTGIYILSIFCRIAALFDNKIKAMCEGHKHVFEDLKQLDKNKKTLWFHCASLGEFEQARNLIEEIKQKYKDCQILLTFFSPSGYEVRKDYKQADCVTYLPFDTPKRAEEFIKAADPYMVFFIKYEFWWNYIRKLRNRKLYSVSLILRKNHYLFKPYGSWFRKQLKCFDMFFVQNEQTSSLLNNAGYTNNIISSDTRFDRVYKMSKEQKSFPLTEQFKDNKKILLLGSSWDKDELLVSNALKEDDYLQKHRKDYKIIIAPHLVHKSHITALKNLFESSIALSELNGNNCRDYDVLIIDCIGILMYLYSLCDYAYIGGGFGAGIHNILEAAVFDKPVAFGPNNKNFREAQELIALQGAEEIKNSAGFASWFKTMMSDENLYAKKAAICGNYVRQNTGATDKIMKTICSEL